MSVRFLVFFAAAVLPITAATRAETIIDSDTTIAGTIDDDVSIVGAVSGERPPVINLLDPGHIAGGVLVERAAVLNLSGGTIGRGTGRGIGIGVLDGGPLTSVVNFSGTRVGGGIYARNAVVNMSQNVFLTPLNRGSMIDLRGSVLNMSGGWIPKGMHTILEGSVAHISGGQVEGGLYVSDSTLTISGGTFDSLWSIGVVQDGEVHVYGGDILVRFSASSGGTIHVYGYDLDYSDQVLTGRLADGTEISTSVNADVGALVLHEIPEPAVWIGLVSGIAAFMLSGWFRTARRVFLGRRAVILQG